MKKIAFKDFFPILIVLLCAAVVGVLLLTGTIDLNTIPELVQDNKALALVIILALFIIKGFSAVILYNPLIIMVSLVFPIWQALIINGIGTAVTLSISYFIGSRTNTDRLESLLSKNKTVEKCFRATKNYGFVFCLAIHLLGLSLEVQGIIFGMLRIGFWTYLTSSWIAIVPGMICFTILGNTWDFTHPVFWIVLAVDLIMILFGVLYTRKTIRQGSAQEEPSSDAPSE